MAEDAKRAEARGGRGRPDEPCEDNSPLAVEGTKAVLSEIHRGQVEAGLRYVAAWNAGHLLSDDLREAVTAFFERREPRFTGH